MNANKRRLSYSIDLSITITLNEFSAVSSTDIDRQINGLYFTFFAVAASVIIA